MDYKMDAQNNDASFWMGLNCKEFLLNDLNIRSGMNNSENQIFIGMEKKFRNESFNDVFDYIIKLSSDGKLSQKQYQTALAIAEYRQQVEDGKNKSEKNRPRMIITVNERLDETGKSTNVRLEEKLGDYIVPDFSINEEIKVDIIDIMVDYHPGFGSIRKASMNEIYAVEASKNG